MCEHCHPTSDRPTVEPVAEPIADETDEITCEHCGGEFAEKDTQKDEAGDVYCQDCYSEQYTSCEECGTELSVDDVQSCEYVTRRYPTRRESSGCFCQSCFDDKFDTCSACSDTFRRCDLTEIEGSSYCDSCASENFVSCENCGEYVSTDDYVSVNDSCYCEGCAPANDEDFEAIRFRPSNNSNERIGSNRSYGVELETSRCDGYGALAERVHFGAKDDGSISGKEFVSTVLRGDAGLEAIEKFCTLANDEGFAVDKSCGYHAHFGVGDLGITELKAVAYAYKLTECVWQLFVSRERRGNNYCGPVEWTRNDLESLADVDEFRDWAQNLDRYQWFNLAAYAAHETFEVRLHSGTLDASKVCQWVTAHARFIDWASEHTLAQIHAEFAGLSVQGIFNKLAEIWASPELTAFYTARASKFGSALGNPVHFAHAS